MVSCPYHLLQRERLSDKPSPENTITAVTSHQEARTQIVVVTSSVLVTGLITELFTVVGWEVAVFGRTLIHKWVFVLRKHSDCVGDQLCPGHWSLVGALYCGWLVVCLL